MDFHMEIMTKTNKAVKVDAALGFPTPRRTEKYADVLLDWWASEVNHNFYIFEIPAVCKITFIKGSLTLKKKKKESRSVVFWIVDVLHSKTLEHTH